jgi:hypothetical protein
MDDHADGTDSASWPTTTSRSWSETTLAQAADPYVQPNPIVSPLVATTTMTVVEDQAVVPSASGV